MKKILIDDYMDDFNSDDWLNQLDEDWEANVFSDDGEYQGGEMKGFFEVMEDFALYHEATERDYMQQFMVEERKHNHAYVYEDRNMAKDRMAAAYAKDPERKKLQSKIYYHENKEAIAKRRKAKRDAMKGLFCEEGNQT